MIPTLAREVSLSEAQASRFERDGFVSIEALADVSGEVPWLRQLVDRMTVRRLEAHPISPEVAEGGEGRLIWIKFGLWEAEVLRRTAFVRNAHALAARLLGATPDETQWGLRIFYKPAHHGAETPWHQDEAHRDPHYIHRSVNVWLALDPATPESGCLRYIPGSHKTGIKTHRPVSCAPTDLAMTTDELDPSLALLCPLGPGDAVVHHCRTLHGAGPNLTERHRRALVMVAEAPPIRLDEPMPRPWLEGVEHTHIETNF